MIEQLLVLLFNRTGVVIAMVHIPLPFMILPLRVMKSIPPSTCAPCRLAAARHWPRFS